LAIWRGEHDHTTPYRGDRGIRFEPMQPEGAPRLRASAEARIEDGRRRTVLHEAAERSEREPDEEPVSRPLPF
jgi:hypothetical protein